MQVVLKDEPDIDPNDQNSILEHLDKVVFSLCTRVIFDLFGFLCSYLM